jgi:CyaY protein
MQQHPEIVMTDLEFMDRAEELLARIEASCDRINDESDADVDNQRVGGMVTLAFDNGTQIVVNLQKPLHEVWMAAKAGGFHYRFDGAQWSDTKGQGEFFAHLARYASEQAGRPLKFGG